MLRKTAITSLILLGLAGGAGFLLLTQPNELPADSLQPRQANLANGETIFNIGGCASCHATPKEDPRTRTG